VWKFLESSMSASYFLRAVTNFRSRRWGPPEDERGLEVKG
jgi:hypothetical protein